MFQLPYLVQTGVKCAREKQAVRELCFFRLVCLVLIGGGYLCSLELFGGFMHEFATFSMRVADAFFLFGVSGVVGEIP